jgi:hypothetical protein
MTVSEPLMATLPPPWEVRRKLGEVLREVELLRGMLRLAERAESYRKVIHQRTGEKRDAGTAA